MTFDPAVKFSQYRAGVGWGGGSSLGSPRLFCELFPGCVRVSENGGRAIKCKGAETAIYWCRILVWGQIIRR